MADYDVGATILEIVDRLSSRSNWPARPSRTRSRWPPATRSTTWLSERAIPGLSDQIVPTTLEVATPLDFERRLLAPEGAFLGLSMERSCHRPFSGPQRGLRASGACTLPALPLTREAGCRLPWRPASSRPTSYRDTRDDCAPRAAATASVSAPGRWGKTLYTIGRPAS